MIVEKFGCPKVHGYYRFADENQDMTAAKVITKYGLSKANGTGEECR